MLQDINMSQKGLQVQEGAGPDPRNASLPLQNYIYF